MPRKWKLYSMWLVNSGSCASSSGNSSDGGRVEYEGIGLDLDVSCQQPEANSCGGYLGNELYAKQS